MILISVLLHLAFVHCCMWLSLHVWSDTCFDCSLVCSVRQTCKIKLNNRINHWLDFDFLCKLGSHLFTFTYVFLHKCFFLYKFCLYLCHWGTTATYYRGLWWVTGPPRKSWLRPHHPWRPGPHPNCPNGRWVRRPSGFDRYKRRHRWDKSAVSNLWEWKQAGFPSDEPTGQNVPSYKTLPDVAEDSFYSDPQVIKCWNCLSYYTQQR